jgi:hypothetical protein
MPGQNCSAPAPAPGIDWAQPKAGWAMPQAMNSDSVQNRWLNCVWARSMEPPDAARWREGYSDRGSTAPRFGALMGVLPKHEHCSPVCPLLEWVLASSLRLHRAKAGWKKQVVRRCCWQLVYVHRGCFRPTRSCVRGDLPRSGESAKVHCRQPPNGWACVRDQR